MKQIVLSIFIVSTFLSCSREFENTLSFAIGVTAFSSVRVIETTNKSSFNDTILGWRLSHENSDFYELSSYGLFHSVDIADKNYALDLAKEFFPGIEGNTYSVVLNDSNENIDVYWIYDQTNRESVVLYFEY